MKTLTEILNQPPVFLHNWTCSRDVFVDFEDIYIITEEEALKRHESDHILFASYGTDNWYGDAFVLFECNGKLYEVNGSHCSCYGLEDQWQPDATSIEELAFRLTKGEFGRDDWSGNEFHDELCEFLGI